MDKKFSYMIFSSAYCSLACNEHMSKSEQMNKDLKNASKNLRNQQISTKNF